ncbi:hypothetical protein KPL70_005740 [Citrus sinensis]|nr:hypothetical protein KPL70_005740 [Citrus sinensis]
MGYRSGVVIDLEFDFDGSIDNRSTSELISMLKSSFRDADFAKVESILVEREEERKLELESTMQANDWLKEKLEESGMQKLKAENERNELIERERKAGSLIEFWKKKYEGLESRIRQLDADIMLLASADSHARASSQNGNNVVEETPAPAAPDQGQDCSRLPSGSIIRIIDSDDDCASEEILSRNGTTSLRVAKSYHSSQAGAQHVTGRLKRKHDSCPILNENKNSNGDSVEDEDVDDNSFTADHKLAKIQKLNHGHNVSPINHCAEPAVSSGTSVEKFCTPSSALLGQCESKLGAEHGSQNFMREFLLDVPGICNIDCSSSSSSSSSGSESDVDLDFDFPQLTRIVNYRKWESESEMLAAFEEENELYLKAVCALHRQQTTVGKSPRSSLSSNDQGFNQANAHQSSSNNRGFNQVNAHRYGQTSGFITVATCFFLSKFPTTLMIRMHFDYF